MSVFLPDTSPPPPTVVVRGLGDRLRPSVGDLPYLEHQLSTQPVLQGLIPYLLCLQGLL